MKTLVIPDIHEKVERCENILETFKDVDKRVFLGDFYDSFEWNGRGEVTAKFHQAMIQDPKNIVLMGNHDVPYRWPSNPRLGCSGHTKEQEIVCSRILNANDWNQTQVFTWVDGWLLSHAGYRGDYQLDKGLEAEAIALNGNHPIFGAGYSRGGRQPYGGITWLDWRDEFQPVPHINQIVGHTRGREVREKITENSRNYCIDTDLEHIAIITDGELEIKCIR